MRISGIIRFGPLEEKVTTLGALLFTATLFNIFPIGVLISMRVVLVRIKYV